MKPKLCLGSAQFGLDYGITNNKGKVKPREVKEILKYSSDNNISLIDTAQEYGDSETIIGNSLPEDNSFKIISKISLKNSDKFELKHTKLWEISLKNSLKKLRKNKLEALLIHSQNDLQKPGSKYLINWLLSLKDRGIVNKVGLSIYDKNDLIGINRDFIDIVQLPLSIYDQRLVKNLTISKLRNEGYTIYARSIYLQGLILKRSYEWPNWINKESIKHHQKLENFADRNNLKLINLAIEYIKSQEMIEAAIFGICSLKELKELNKSWRKEILLDNHSWEKWNLNDIKVVNPLLWPNKKQN